MYSQLAVHGGRYRNPDSRLIQNDGDAGIHDFAVAMVVEASFPVGPLQADVQEVARDHGVAMSGEPRQGFLPIIRQLQAIAVMFVREHGGLVESTSRTA